MKIIAPERPGLQARKGRGDLEGLDVSGGIPSGVFSGEARLFQQGYQPQEIRVTPHRQWRYG